MLRPYKGSGGIRLKAKKLIPLTSLIVEPSISTIKHVIVRTLEPAEARTGRLSPWLLSMASSPEWLAFKQASLTAHPHGAVSKTYQCPDINWLHVISSLFAYVGVGLDLCSRISNIYPMVFGSMPLLALSKLKPLLNKHIWYRLYST